MVDAGTAAARPLGARILVVEDERIVARDIQTCLSDLGYDVSDTAASSEQALKLADEHCPDLVLMDIRIKGEKDGIETAAILRRRFDVPIVYLTAYADEPTITRAKQTEPFGYVLKPLRADDLRSVVEIALFKDDVEKRRRDRAGLLVATTRWISDAIVSPEVCGLATAPDVGEGQRLRQRVELAERHALIGTMTAGFVHELNNPLACVLANISAALTTLRERRGASAGMADGPWLEDVVTALVDAETGAESLAKLVRCLKGFTGREHDYERAELGDTLEMSIGIVRHRVAARGRIVRQLGEVPPVHGPSGRLGQVFVNLLINAAHALDPDLQETNEITVSTRTDERGHAVVEIHDTGCGMPPDVVKRAFEPFFTTNSAGGGTGLGLSVSHDIVRSLEGTIAFESEVGRGTTARVTLPPFRAPTTSERAPGVARAAETNDMSRTVGR